MREAARKVLGAISEQGEGRQLWNQKVHESMRSNRMAKKNWDSERDEGSRQEDNGIH